jgi:hypothetical protein
LRYSDPTGHRNCEEDGYNCSGSSGSSGGGNGGNDANGNNNIESDLGLISYGAEWDEDNLTVYFNLGNDYCNESCQMWAEAMSIGATAVDTFAAGANIATALAIDIAVVINPAVAAGLYVDWRIASVFFNSLATVGTVGWALQGLLTGTNGASGEITFNTDSPIFIDSINTSGRLSQDTLGSGILDMAGWAAPGPNTSAAVGTTGVLYDLARNPAPSFFSYNPLISSLYNPSFNYSHDFNSH